MAYCKNCGSILQSNANFCHVCGQKLDVENTFINVDYVEPEAKKEEEPKSSYSDPGFYRSYYDDFNTASANSNQQASPISRRAFVPGMISMIGATSLSVYSGLIMLLTNLLYNEYYEEGAISYNDYITGLKEQFFTTAIYLFLAAILGIVLGSIGIKVSKKYANKKGFIFSIVGISVACVAIGFAVLCLVLRGTI